MAITSGTVWCGVYLPMRKGEIERPVRFISMDKAFLTSLAVALLSGLVVAIWTQWRQDSRHNDLRVDKKEDQKREAFEASRSRQLQALADFIRDVRKLENTRRENWIDFMHGNPIKIDIALENAVQDLNFFHDVLTAIDCLDLEITDPVVHECISPLRTEVKKLRKTTPIDTDTEIEETFIPLMLGKHFPKELQNLVDRARERLTPNPEPPFAPLVT